MRIAPIMLLLLTTSCGMFADPEDTTPITAARPSQDIHARANAWMSELNELVVRLRPIAGLIDLACDQAGGRSTVCVMARAAWATAREAIGTAQDAVSLYYDTGEALEGAEAAIKTARGAAEVMLAAERKLKAVINGADQSSDRGVPIWPQADPRGAAKPQAPAGGTAGTAEGASDAPRDAGAGKNPGQGSGGAP